ncbi:MAG: tRNA (adenosine(37)-N6)-threonylcarbamoyltransferase complex dimerization subunit type 1 TsaB [Spirochaetales bacterium]|nr:tRNA (adenosine(37)-N6)-threonylcarbamoyltransferase complex dimerization subunit type 1 TsaB [Spirochaetales bacterium]
MNILAIDAATAVLSLTLQKGESYYQYNADIGFRHSELIMPAVDRLFAEAELKPTDLDLVCTALGPGSFTGLRVGMATAKGICAATDTPFVAVPTLDILARPFVHFDGLVLPLIDARKKRYFAALYRKGVKLSDYGDLTPEEIFTLVDRLGKEGEKVILTGPDCALFNSHVESRDDRDCFLLDEECRRGNGGAMIALGRCLFEERGPDTMDTGPLYMRKSEAEISLEAKEASTSS